MRDLMLLAPRKSGSGPTGTLWVAAALSNAATPTTDTLAIYKIALATGVVTTAYSGIASGTDSGIPAITRDGARVFAPGTNAASAPQEIAVLNRQGDGSYLLGQNVRTFSSNYMAERISCDDAGNWVRQHKQTSTWSYGYYNRNTTTDQYALSNYGTVGSRAYVGTAVAKDAAAVPRFADFSTIGTVSERVRIWSLTTSTSPTKIATAPASTMNADRGAASKDLTKLVITGTASPWVQALSWAGGTASSMSLLTMDAFAPAVTPNYVDMSRDGNLIAVSHSGGIVIYKWSGSAYTVLQSWSLSGGVAAAIFVGSDSPEYILTYGPSDGLRLRNFSATTGVGSVIASTTPAKAIRGLAASGIIP